MEKNRTMKKAKRFKTLKGCTLTFGKHRGHRLAAIPESYLRWVIDGDKAPMVDRWVITEYLKAKDRTGTAHRKRGHK